MEIDRKTRVAVQISHLETALSSARKAIAVETDDYWRARLTLAAGVFSEGKRRAEQTWASIVQGEANVASAALEG